MKDVKKNKKSRKNHLEAMIFQILEKSMKKALEAAIDEVLHDLK